MQPEHLITDLAHLAGSMRDKDNRAALKNHEFKIGKQKYTGAEAKDVRFGRNEGNKIHRDSAVIYTEKKPLKDKIFHPFTPAKQDLQLKPGGRKYPLNYKNDTIK